MSVGEISANQLAALVTIERVCSSLSIAGCFFIIVTFLTSKAFHKPINRLVFYASVGNVMTNIATLISRSALDNADSFLCQFQGFLIQMFMAADALWTAAMACNVYLTFFHKYDAERLRSLEKWYFLACYGVPFIPAFVYIFIHSSNGARFYGNATLWCWVSQDFDVFRIVTFYAPVWIAIAITFAIYIRAGKEIYKKRRQLSDFGHTDPDNMTLDNSFRSTKTTEVHVTSEDMPGASLGSRQAYYGKANTSERPIYSVSISAKHEQSSNIDNKNMDPVVAHSEVPNHNHRVTGREINNAAWSYTKVAVLFFTAMLVTWIPSSANRVFSVVHPGSISIPLTFASAFVLPLQGFWNAVIYISTSLSACRLYFGGMKVDMRRSEARAAGANNGFGAGVGRGNRLSSRSETESTTELAMRSSTVEGANSA